MLLLHHISNSCHTVTLLTEVYNTTIITCIISVHYAYVTMLLLHHISNSCETVTSLTEVYLQDISAQHAQCNMCETSLSLSHPSVISVGHTSLAASVCVRLLLPSHAPLVLSPLVNFPTIFPPFSKFEVREFLQGLFICLTFCGCGDFLVF